MEIAFPPASGVQNWTPDLSFVTRGDLSVSYTQQVGHYVQVGKLVFYNFSLVGTPTFTTASGSLQINGLPLTCEAMNYAGQLVSQSAGLTWANTGTQLNPRVGANTTTINLISQKSAASSAVLSTTAVVSGVAVTIQGCGWYIAA